MRTRGTVKLHLVLDNHSFLPQFAALSEEWQAGVKVARQMDFPPGALLVFDCGCEDHNWWRKPAAGAVGFVTRLKDSTGYTIREERAVREGSGVLPDEVIVLDRERDPDHLTPMPRIDVWLEDQQVTIAFVTHNLKLAAATIAAIHRDRWQIGGARNGHFAQPVKVRPGPQASDLVAWQAPW